MNITEFTSKEKMVIAEFVFSNSTDVLIKSDAISLIDVLEKHNLISDPDDWKEKVNAKEEGIVDKLSAILEDTIPSEQGKILMDDYYSGKLR